MIKITKTTLGDLIEFQRGFDLTKSEMIDGPYPVRSSNGILGYHNEYKTNGPGITIGRSGTVGIPHLIKEDFYPHNTSLYIKDFKGNNVSYIFYLLTNLKLGDRGSGSGVPTMNRNHLHPLNILAHLNVTTQEKIAKVLSDLDAKIEVNNKINQELEAMAKTLYDYWFVQFDFPDVNSKPYKSSGGKFVYNKQLKREIPEGWWIEKLSECSNIVDCLHSKKSDFQYENENYYLLQLENIRKDGLIDLSSKYYVSKEDYKRWTTRIEVEDNDLIITNAGRVAGLSQIPKNVKAGIGRNITAIRPTTIKPTFLYYTFQGAEMERQIKLNTDTGSFFKSLNVRGIKELNVIRPPKALEDKFENITLQFRRKRELNSFQNQKLTELRDWLLPMLMNGQVRVGELKDDLEIESEEKLEFAAEPPTPYGNESLLSNLFPMKDLYAEVACMLAIEKEMHRKSRGKTWVQKTANHLKEIKKEPKLKDVIFEEYPWGMFSQTIAIAIDSNPFLTIDDVAGVSVYKVRFNKIAELNQWMQEPHNADFVASAKDIVSLYDDPLINNDLDRIELLNTVYHCIQKLEITDFDSIHQAMRNWRMREQGYANKAEKFKPEEIKLMIQFIKNEILKG